MTLPIAVLLVFVAQAPAATTPRYERPVTVAAPGPQRLAIDATLLAAGAPFTVVRRGAALQRLVAEDGLSDLRLTATDGREVPYLLVYPAVADPQWRTVAVQPIAGSETATQKTSGFEADLGSIEEVDGIALRSPGPFMKRFSLEASGDREHWTLVVPDATLFDVPDRALRQTHADFRPAAYRYLRLTWDDTRSARMPLPASIAVRLATDAPPPEPGTVALAFERRPSEPGRSRYHITLPGSRLPLTALRLDAAGTYLFRSITVTEPRLAEWQAAPITIGEGLLFRDQPSGAPLRVPIRQPSQAELDLVVEDGDNPPLDLRGVTGEFAELPWIYFDAPGPLVAHYGAVGLPRPSYDLEAARASVRIDAVPAARWGPPAAAPAAAAAPSIDPASLTGGALDVSSFRYSRAITGDGSRLVALPLDAAVLAHSAGPVREFADVRIVDGDGRQVPRLVERRPEPLVLRLPSAPATPEAAELQPKPGQHRSVYRITLPYAALPDARLVIGTTAAVFRRRVDVGYERPADRAHRDPWFLRVATTDWSRVEDAPAILTLSLNTAVADATQLTLVVDEGDNSALPIASVQLLLPSYRLRFVRPATASRLVYGGGAIDAPRYDLALLAPAVLSAPVTEVSMAAEAQTAAPGAIVKPLISPAMFWAVLAVAVVALLGVLVALLR